MRTGILLALLAVFALLAAELEAAERPAYRDLRRACST